MLGQISSQLFKNPLVKAKVLHSPNNSLPELLKELLTFASLC